MKFSTKLLSAAVLMASSSIALAATTTIDLQVTKDAYVNFTGTIDASATLPQAAPGVVGLPAGVTNVGNFGTETNVTGACDLTVTSANDFNLAHSVSGADLYPSTYSVAWGAEGFGFGDTAAILTSCTNAAASLDITTPVVSTVVPNGLYEDTLTITVAVQ